MRQRRMRPITPSRKSQVGSLSTHARARVTGTRAQLNSRKKDILVLAPRNYHRRRVKCKREKRTNRLSTRRSQLTTTYPHQRKVLLAYARGLCNCSLLSVFRCGVASTNQRVNTSTAASSLATCRAERASEQAGAPSARASILVRAARRAAQRERERERAEHTRI